MSDSTIEKLLFLLLGWSLGLLAPIIVDGIKRKRENRLGRVAIQSELNEFAGRIAIAAYGAKAQAGLVDRTFLEWLKAVLEINSKNPKSLHFASKIGDQLSLTDEQLHTVFQRMVASNGKGTLLTHITVPLLDARVAAMWSFDTKVQRQLLDIRQNIEFLNDIVNRSRKYFDMTFTDLTEKNFKSVEENLEQTYVQYADRAIGIVDQIRLLQFTRK